MSEISENAAASVEVPADEDNRTPLGEKTPEEISVKQSSSEEEKFSVPNTENGIATESSGHAATADESVDEAETEEETVKDQPEQEVNSNSTHDQVEGPIETNVSDSDQPMESVETENLGGGNVEDGNGDEEEGDNGASNDHQDENVEDKIHESEDKEEMNVADVTESVEDKDDDAEVSELKEEDENIVDNGQPTEEQDEDIADTGNLIEEKESINVSEPTEKIEGAEEKEGDIDEKGDDIEEMGDDVEEEDITEQKEDDISHSSEVLEDKDDNEAEEQDQLSTSAKEQEEPDEGENEDAAIEENDELERGGDSQGSQDEGLEDENVKVDQSVENNESQEPVDKGTTEEENEDVVEDETLKEEAHKSPPKTILDDKDEEEEEQTEALDEKEESKLLEDTNNETCDSKEVNEEVDNTELSVRNVDDEEKMSVDEVDDEEALLNQDDSQEKQSTENTAEVQKTDNKQEEYDITENKADDTSGDLIGDNADDSTDKADDTSGDLVGDKADDNTDKADDTSGDLVDDKADDSTDKADDTLGDLVDDKKADDSTDKADLEMTEDGKEKQELLIQDVRVLNEDELEEEKDDKTEEAEEKPVEGKDEDVKEKVDEDVEMADLSDEKKETTDDKQTSNDVEMVEDDTKKISQADDDEKTDDVKKMEEGKDGSAVRDESMEESDVKIIDIRSDDEDGEKEKKDKASTGENVKEEKDDDGGMCLQIASVSGGANMDLFKDDDMKQEEDKKVEVKREETATVKSEPKSELKVDTANVKKEVKQEIRTPAASKPSSKAQSCIVCFKVGKCKYNIVRNGDIKHLCDDVCFKRFRSNPTMFLRAAGDSPQKKPDTPPTTTPTTTQSTPTVPPPQEHYKTCSICQLMNLKTSKPFLNWQGMDFCGEDCLGKFQGGLNAACSFCGKSVSQAAKGKFCSRVGNEVKQFCSGNCFSEFKKRQKLCECCQKDLSKNADAFVAPVGKDAVFKDFCSQDCHQKYEKISADSETSSNQVHKSQFPPKGNFTCAVCSKIGPVKHEIRLDGKMNRLCSDPCFSAFQYANKLFMNTCDNCGIYCYKDGSSPQFIQFEGQQKRFCSFMCVNSFKTLNKKVVSCAWCNCKKSNFDMIERVDANNKYQLFCSLNCLSLYRVNLQATSNQAVVCDQCRKCVPAQYHLTMSDASVRNFCSYQCVMAFQSQFASGAKTHQFVANTSQSAPANQTRVATRSSSRTTAGKTSQANVPVISNVVSLAQDKVTQKKESPAILRDKVAPKKENPAVIRGTQQQQTRANTGTPAILNHLGNNRAVTVSQQTQVQQQIIIQPPPPKAVKNKSVLCKAFVQTKATSCRPHTQTKETQTEEDNEPKKFVIPVPVPYYIPMPMQMWSQPTPVPIPMPVPVPVPIFIPTTRKSASGIMKQIKEIQERIPSDPLEAELLMMAEAVAGGEPESESDSDRSEMELDAVPHKNLKKTSPSPPPPPSADKEVVAPAETSEFGEDMLQMALRMATEMTSEPVMDLETSIEPVPVNTEPPPPPPRALPEDDDDADYTPVRETRSRGRGQKRSGARGARRSKRQKVVHNQEPDLSMEEQPQPEPEPQEPPADANFYLKYTYGVNAWKHWVVQKNAQLEKVSKTGSGKLKLFKTDMMGCSADELNYSLCLFVKEVRKPNGEEYAPDSIHYLCLGIQQYLFENGRIDNIFTDMYYEKFTECLNEVLARYEPRVNTAGQLVCRIEEEHLWECKQLGAHSPHVLLNTLVYFNTKYFMLKETDDHLKLSFTHIMKHWKKCPIGRGNTTGRSVYLRYYCPTPTKATNDIKKKTKEELPVYEQAENTENPLRCPVKLYEFYLSKWIKPPSKEFEIESISRGPSLPESIKNRNDAFYLTPERSCVPDSPVWYSTQNLSAEAMNKMLNRVRLVREIQEAMLHTQPVTNFMT